MIKRSWRLALGALMVALVTIPAVAFGQAVQYTATLSGANVVPPKTTTATGTFTTTLDEAAGT